MSGNDLLLRHSALQNALTPMRHGSSAETASNGTTPPHIHLPFNQNQPQQSHNNPNSNSNPNSNHNRRRLQAERAAIRQRLRNEFDKQQTEMRRQRENNEKIRIWKDQILPRWNELQHTNKVKELCARGIPSNVRGKVWPLLIENQLNVRKRLNCQWN